MSGSLNALAMPGIGASSPTNALAPLLPPSTGLDPAQAQQFMLQQGGTLAATPTATPGQPQGLTPQQQYAAMLQLMQVQQAQQQQAAAQAKAFQQQQEFWQSNAGRANEGGAGGSADHGGADSGVI